jgi:hypothetical protein
MNAIFAKLKALWEHLITKEKALWKSATVYVGAVITAMPQILDYADANFPAISSHLPTALHDPVMHAIGVAVLVARGRSLIKIPPIPPAATALLLGIMMLAFAAAPVYAANPPPQAVLTWGTVTTHTDGTPTTGVITYSIYQGAKGAEAATPVLTGLTATTTTITAGLLPGTTVCWYGTATEAGGLESAPSNEACKTFPTPPAVPATLTVK